MADFRRPDGHAWRRRGACSRTAFLTSGSSGSVHLRARRAIPPSPTSILPVPPHRTRQLVSQWHTRRAPENPTSCKSWAQPDLCGDQPCRRGTLENHHEYVGHRGIAARHMRARAHLTQVVAPGQVFVPMHWPEANQLTLGAVDPYSRQPAYKHCAVRIRREDDLEG